MKNSGLQMLTTRFEEIKTEDDESYNEFYAKLNDIVNSDSATMTNQRGEWISFWNPLNHTYIDQLSNNHKKTKISKRVEMMQTI